MKSIKKYIAIIMALALAFIPIMPERAVQATGDTFSFIVITLTSTEIDVGGTSQANAYKDFTYTQENNIDQYVTWESGNTAILTITTSGAITGVSAGIATIAAISLDGTVRSTGTTQITVMGGSPTPTPTPHPTHKYHYIPYPTPEPVSEIAKEVEATITDTTVKADNKVGVELTKSKAADFVGKTSEGETAVKIELKKFTIELDKAALDTIVEGTKEAEDVITIKADEYDKDKLTDKQKEIVEEKKPELVFEAYVERNNERVHDFNGGQATVGIVFAPAEDPSHYFVEYINPDGTVERFPTWYENGKLCFTTGHFSEYMVVYDETETNGKPAEIVPDAFLTIKKKMAVGNTFNLVSTVTKGKELTFTSSDKSVAKVTKKGVIKAKGAGKCTVTAECEGYKLVVNVRVSDTPSGQAQTPEEVAWTGTTDSAVIAVYKKVIKGNKYRPNFTGAEDAEITYEIENEKIAYVKNGEIVGRKRGETIVDIHVKEGSVENVYRFLVRVK